MPSTIQCHHRISTRPPGKAMRNSQCSTKHSTLSTAVMGWLMGLEPTTPGITIQYSTIELQPPCENAVPSAKFSVLSDPAHALPLLNTHNQTPNTAREGGSGTPGGTRTHNPRLRRPVLYPLELRAPRVEVNHEPVGAQRRARRGDSAPSRTDKSNLAIDAAPPWKARNILSAALTGQSNSAGE